MPTPQRNSRVFYTPSPIPTPQRSSTSSTARSRLSAGSDSLTTLIRIEPIRTTEYPRTELQFIPPPTKCPAPPCPNDYWWAPKPRKSKREQKKLDEEMKKPYLNVMYEKRVIKGANFAATLMDDFNPFDKAADQRRQKALRKISEKYNCKARNKRNVIGTVPPLPGREHIPIQTEKYLEELVAQPPAFEVDTQTDLFLERPPIPPYKPSKIGVDASTEIGDGELFHFDAEAQPIIDVLVDGAIEQSILEVAHEQEIGALRAQQEKFLCLREAELAELRRLEAEDMRLEAEKERRLRQDCIAKELDEEMQRAVVAAKIIQGHVSSLLPEIWDNLEPATERCQKEHLLLLLCPWLSDQVREESKHIIQSRNILDQMIADIVKDRATIYGGYCDDIGEPLAIEEGETEMMNAGEDEACSCDTSITMSGHSSNRFACGPNEKNV